MSWYSRRLTQPITRWVSSTTIDVWGETTAWVRTEIKGRWEDSRARFIDKEGRDTFSNAMVFLKDEVNEGDYLFKGSSTASDPTAVAGAYMIRKMDTISSLNDKLIVRRALL